MTRVPLPLGIALERMKLDPVAADPKTAIGQVTLEPHILQDFRPLPHTLEWELSDLHWSTAGLLSFAENDVPFIVNNTGRLSEHAATVLFANCLEQEPGDRILVLELGAGTGLFARYFLDAFRAICEQESRDFYARLVYHVTDRSPRTVEQWEERNLFVDHAGHVAPRMAHGMRPDVDSIRAVFCNYVLDVLPSTVIRQGAVGCEELVVRTNLCDDPALLAQYTKLTMEELKKLAASDNPADRVPLIPLASLFELELDFRPPVSALPSWAADALEFGKGLERVLLNHGAVACLEGLLERLDPHGFVLVNDYGATQPDQVAAQGATQRFGSTTALGLNFPYLEEHFRRRGRTVVIPEDDEERRIHARLLSGSAMPRTAAAFQNRFGRDGHQYFEAPIEEGRRHIQAGRKNEALESFRIALDHNPRDWYVLGEVAEFVGLQLRDFAAGLEIARAAVALNPWYSAWLWNLLGDCLFCLGRFDGAHEAYLQAQRIDPADVRTNLNLAYTFFQAGSHLEALQAIALGLSKDARCVYRARLLDKQQQVLNAIAARWLGEQERLIRRAIRLV